MSYKTWMSDTAAIHDRKLRNICLPTTHDSGTYALTSRYTSDPVGDDMKEALDILKKISDDIASIPGIGKLIPDPVAWVYNSATDAVRGLATATKKSFTEQLERGIRGFDLRVCYDSNSKKFCTFHGLIGTPMDDVLNQFKSFLSSTNGEILYLTMGHFTDFPKDGQATYAKMVTDALGPWVYAPQLSHGNITNNVFDQTWRQIVTAGGGQKSKVILVWGQGSTPSDSYWPKQYSPPDNKDGNTTLAGYYTNDTNVDKVLSTQKRQFDAAVKANLPFALYMTLTPSTGQYASVVTGSLASAIAKLGASALALGPVGVPIAAALETVAAGLGIYKATLDWTTLDQLSAKLDDHLGKYVVDNILGSYKGTNPLSFIYLDFFEHTSVVDLAISLSQDQVMRWSGNERIPNLGAQTATYPALCAFNGKLYMTYRGDNHSDIYQATFDGRSWAGNKRLKDISSIDPDTAKSPALAVYNGKVYMAYRGEEKKDIYLATFDGNSWAGNKKISEISAISPKTSESPALAVYNGKLYMAYRGDDHADIYLATFDGNAWSGDKKISEISSIHPKTSESPALAVFGGKLYMAYRGDDKTNIYISVFDGHTWSGDKKISDLSAIDPETKTGVALVASDKQLLLFYRGDEHTNIYVTMFNGDTWSGNERISEMASIDPETATVPAAALFNGTVYIVYRGANHSDIYLTTGGIQSLS